MGQLRIVAGRLKGRRIEVPAGTPVRPTADRVREALFSILGAAVPEARVLDAYAGSGALGFEALSRGAASVVFVEADRLVLERLARNAERLAVHDQCVFRESRAAEWLARDAAAGLFDLILADPPYGSAEAARFLPAAASRLARDGTIVIERDGGDAQAFEPAGLVLYRSNRYGRTRLDFYRTPS